MDALIVLAVLVALAAVVTVDIWSGLLSRWYVNGGKSDESNGMNDSNTDDGPAAHG